MAGKKVKFALISNESARTTFKKRKNGLMKNVSELSTLCGVSACAIIYSLYGKCLDVWPSISDAQRVLARFEPGGIPLVKDIHFEGAAVAERERESRT
ncbi:PREDICTED: agamous-like MADS-box protein AGL80 [Nelumbo nucifera]|uniref:Agamous-like MADS-box protein AGL80 n=1 Tax=Nelumbo nucifera TaxID=4432 RepID=A0A1U7Z455_NELNU|nr:PREDICTED: agamous-like MADS-box protein AGL80 [Nelumbo nucifera]